MTQREALETEPVSSPHGDTEAGLVDGLSQHITGIISDGPEQLERETAGR